MALLSNGEVFFFVFWLFRIREDEVHVTTGCSDPEMEPFYDEAGAFSGGYTGEQQRRRTEGKGLSVWLPWFHTVGRNHPIMLVNGLPFSL